MRSSSTGWTSTGCTHSDISNHVMMDEQKQQPPSSSDDVPVTELLLQLFPVFISNQGLSSSFFFPSIWWWC
jgi:hypothetical protein